MSSPSSSFIRRAACPRPFPVLVKSKLHSLSARLTSPDWTQESLSRSIKTLNDQLDRNIFDPINPKDTNLSREDIATIRDRLFMADLFVCLDMRTQAAEQTNDAIAIIDRSLMGPLLMRKRLFEDAADVGILDALPGSARMILAAMM